jgi:hypothetical protein
LSKGGGGCGYVKHQHEIPYMTSFSELGWKPRNLSHFELPFTEDEAKRVIVDAPKEKAPGPDDFIAIFFSSY